MVVDLPAPLGPRNPKISPLLNSQIYVVNGNKIPKGSPEICHLHRYAILIHILFYPKTSDA